MLGTLGLLLLLGSALLPAAGAALIPRPADR
jgi:hypothetical protein